MGENRGFVFLDPDLVEFIMASSCTHVVDLRRISLAKQFPPVYKYHIYYTTLMDRHRGLFPILAVETCIHFSIDSFVFWSLCLEVPGSCRPSARVHPVARIASSLSSRSLQLP